MIRTFVLAVVAAFVTSCASTEIDADTRDLLRRDMTAVATAAAGQDYTAASEALERLLDDTEAAYLAGKLTSSKRSEIMAAAAKVQADLDAALAPPPETKTSYVPLPSVPTFDWGNPGGQGNQGNQGNGNGGGNGNQGNNGNGNGGGRGRN